MDTMNEVEKKMEERKYEEKAIRWLDKGDHYELIFTDDFVIPSSGNSKQESFLRPSNPNTLLTDVIIDMRKGCKDKEVHVFVGSFGGEVAALNMILQQLLSYRHRVGINLGAACSCGWILLFACQERYVSPFSQAMFHDIASVCGGKHMELQLNAEFMARCQKELLKFTDTAKFLSSRELELSHTTELWLTGRELIERGAAKDYSEYLTRVIPQPASGLIEVDGEIYGHTETGWVKMEMSKDNPLTYADLVKKANPSREEHADNSGKIPKEEPVSGKKKKDKKKKK